MEMKPTAAPRLDSWKEIAAYLRRGVRTVQRWERDEGLPVHRLAHGKRGRGYAPRRGGGARGGSRGGTPSLGGARWTPGGKAGGNHSRARPLPRTSRPKPPKPLIRRRARSCSG